MLRIRDPVFEDPWDMLNFVNDVWSQEQFLPRHRYHLVRFPRREGEMSENSVIANNNDKFQIALDVSHFAPEELRVTTMDSLVQVEGKHEERRDQHGTMARHFVRKYHLPEGVDPTTVVSSLGEDGKLKIEAPKQNPEKPNERNVPIRMVGAGKEPKKLAEHEEEMKP